MLFKLLLLCFFSSALGIKRCISEKSFLRFYKVKSCYKSTLSMISWKNFKNVEDCTKFTRDKGGLAFNFSPPELRNLTQNRWFRNCQVLGCPEIKNTSTLIFDPAFDYYTAYGNFNSTENATCIKTIGLFNVIQQKMNYTNAIHFCQNIDGDLADVLSETRTNALAPLLGSMNIWYKAAYVGLEDRNIEGTFETPLGNFMECTRFRAWSVGHPRPGHKREDCVILNHERTWTVVNCKIKLPFICEFYPAGPPDPMTEFSSRNCTKIKNRIKKRQCLDNNELSQLYKNLTRIDQCALLNDFN